MRGLDTGGDRGEESPHVHPPLWGCTPYVTAPPTRKKSMRKTLLAAFATLVTVCGLAFAAAPAQASTGGTLDGDLHPDVGLIAFYDSTGRFRCSATLVSPTVVITAAHCTSGTLGKTAVTFDTFIDDAAPSNLPVAATPAAGYTAAELAAAGYLSGTAYTHPAYSDFTDMDNWNDVGVIVLDEPVESNGAELSLDRRNGHARWHPEEPPVEDALHCGRLRHRGASGRRRATAEADPQSLPDRASLRRHARSEAHAADPPDERQRERQPRHRRHLLRRLRRPGVPRRRDRRA